MTLCFCVNDSKRGITVLISGAYSSAELKSKGILMPSSPEEDAAEGLFAIVKIINNDDVCIFLPCQNKDGVLIYYPSTLEEYEKADGDVENISIIDCFGCDRLIKLNPSDSLSLCSDISAMGACKNTKISNVVFIYPYACDTAKIIGQSFEVRCELEGCRLKAAPSFIQGCKR